jgi:N-acetylglutamate synthase-like GNAT family acetyltransferase
MDILFLRKDKRGGRGGVILLKAVKAELKRRGVDRWFVGTKVHMDISPLFEAMGFEPVEKTYSMYLGGD